MPVPSPCTPALCCNLAVMLADLMPAPQALLAPSSGNDAAALCFLCSPVSQVLLAANRLPGGLL